MNKYVKNIYTKFGLILLNRYGVNNFLSMQIEHHLGGEHGGWKKKNSSGNNKSKKN